MKNVILIFFTLLCTNVHSQNYETTQVVVEPFTDTIQRTGKLDFKSTVLLTFKTDGYLSRIAVDEGDAFQKGDLLASLDVTELVADKNSKYALLLQAKRELSRAEELLRKKLGTQQDLDLVTTELETTRSSYQVAFYNLEKAELKAPFTGVVLSRHTDLGELQTPGKAVLRVATLTRNWVVKVALTGSEIDQVKLAQKVDVYIAGRGRLQGEVVKIPAIANTNANLFLIDILLPELDSETRVIAGQLADVKIDFSSSDLVYRLPIDALVRVNDEGKAVILTQGSSENTFIHRFFDIHKIDNQFVYLLAGSQEDALQVIVRGWQHIEVEK